MHECKLFNWYKGFNSLKEIAEEAAKLLTVRQKIDEDMQKNYIKHIIFGCTVQLVNQILS